MIKTKIVATLGPASNTADKIGRLIEAGVDVFRLNFSHGSLDEHALLLENIDRARRNYPRTVAVMGDLCGPKIRTGNISPEGEMLNRGDKVIIEPGIEDGSSHHFGTNYAGLVADAQPNHRIMIDDGQISLVVKDKNATQVICEVAEPGPISSHKGINLPDSDIAMPSITKRDWQCVDWAIEHKIDFLALSFVRSAKELKELRAYLQKADSPIKLVSKIEKPQAVTHLESIVMASDVVLVARGDLGVEMDLAHVPLIQKRITRLCRHLGKPVIVATQMLQSMIEHPVPTRAEVSDVANAIMDLTDAVMLSGETAVGKYPVETVTAIKKIAHTTESYLDDHKAMRRRENIRGEIAMTEALARGAAQVVDETNAKLVVILSRTGNTTRLLSKSRIDAPIIVFSPDLEISRQMCMYYGVVPMCRPTPSDIKHLADDADKIILKYSWAKPGDQIVLLAGSPLTPEGTTNALMVHAVTEQ